MGKTFPSGPIKSENTNLSGSEFLDPNADNNPFQKKLLYSASIFNSPATDFLASKYVSYDHTDDIATMTNLNAFQNSRDDLQGSKSCPSRTVKNDSKASEFVTFKSPKEDLSDDESTDRLADENWSVSSNLFPETSTRSNFYSGESEGNFKAWKFSLDALDVKKFVLSHFIQEDLKVADLKWSLFCAACRSYRYNSVLRPFPPNFVDSTYNFEIDRLREVTELAPPLSILYEQLRDKSEIIPSNFISLLYWVLIHHRNPKLKLLPKDQTNIVLRNVSANANWTTGPDYIFQVNYDNRLPIEQRFAEMAVSYQTIFAFHGSRLENFYSILIHGLQVALNKTSAFGKGIYLSSELNVSLAYSPPGFGWGKSALGHKLSIVALCEMINHPDVKYQDGTSLRKALAEGSENGPLPKKYFLVQNSDLVRVRYLLVYCHEDEMYNEMIIPRSLTGWLKKYKVFIMIAAYVLLLLAIGLFNSASFYRYYRRLLRRIGFRILHL